jgi:hypothetical protein
MVTRIFVLVTLLAGVMVVAALPISGFSAQLQIAQTADDVVLRNVKISQDGEVSGEVQNNSKQALRDLDIEILYSWQWKNEFRPGKDDPGRAVDIRIDKEIPPGQSVPFNYKPSPPLPVRKDGYFGITVKVVGLTRIYR